MDKELLKEEALLDLLHSIKELILEIKSDLVDLFENIEIEDGEDEEEELPSTQNTSANGGRKRKSAK